MSLLARTSLVIVGVMALGNAGCLITESTDFSAPKEIPPYFSNLRPPPNKILVIPSVTGPDPSGNTYVQDIQIDFDVRSEDLQRQLFGVILIDYPPRSNPNRMPDRIPRSLDNFQLGVGTLDTPRHWTSPLAVPPSVVAGCHPITAVVSHNVAIYNAKIDVKDGIATWWAQVGVDQSDPMYEPCVPDPVPGDAGVDVVVEGGGR